MEKFVFSSIILIYRYQIKKTVKIIISLFTVGILMSLQLNNNPISQFETVESVDVLLKLIILLNPTSARL